MMEGHILRTIDYKESSMLLYVYTEKGIKSMIARGVKKLDSPLRHLAQTSNRLEMTLTKGNLPTLKEATLVDRLPEIKDDFIKSTIMGLINELIYKTVTNDDNHPKLYAFLHKFTAALKTSDAPLELMLVFELKMLHFLGYAIPLRRCHVCGARETLMFDVHEGALVCEKHTNANHVHYDQAIYLPMQYYYYVDITTFKKRGVTGETFKTIHKITEQLERMHLGFTPRARTILQPFIT